MKTCFTNLRDTDDFSLLFYSSGIFPSGINSFSEYLFHIYNVLEILLHTIKSEITDTVPAFRGKKLKAGERQEES